MFLTSRFIGLFDVPDPEEINVNFVYNFFVPDERVNTDPNPSFQGSDQGTQAEINEKTMQRNLPRYVEIEYTPTRSGLDEVPVNIPSNIVASNFDLIQTEETITSNKDVAISQTMPRISYSLGHKSNLLSSLVDPDAKGSIEKSKAIESAYEDLDQNMLLQAMSTFEKDGKVMINEVDTVTSKPQFDSAENAVINAIFDRRLLQASFGGDYTYENTLKTILRKKALNDSLSYLPNAPTDADSDSSEPNLTPVSIQNVLQDSDVVKAYTVGYMIERQEDRLDGLPEEKTIYYVDGLNSTRYVDTAIRYGSEFRYSVRTVALVEKVIASPGSESLNPGYYKCKFLIASKPSPPKIVKAIEKIPPKEPDGVFYRFNYDRGAGLFIRWQIPIGKQRDTKYFQIFRRKSIKDPFECIAELDFDNSVKRSPRFENINSDIKIMLKGAKTTYLDTSFTRDSSYIYAICAVDAHGLTSGYSAQSLVSFNKITNDAAKSMIKLLTDQKLYNTLMV